MQRRPPRQASDLIEHQVKQIWLEVLKLKDIDLDVSLESAGADSLAAAMISLRLYKAFRVEIPPQQLQGAASIASTAERVRKAQPPQTRLET